MKKLTLLYAIFLLFVVSLFANERMIVRIDNPSSTQVLELLSANYDIASYFPEKYVDIVVDAKGMLSLQNKGYQPSIRQTEAEIKQNLIKVRDIPGYHPYAENLAILQSYAETYPTLCKLVNIGTTTGKQYSEQGYTYYDDFQQDIWALKLSDNVNIEEDEPCVYYFGGHHAREPIGSEVTMAVLANYLNNYNSDTVLHNLIDSTQIWFVPMVNPNGQKIVLDQIDVMWRKNIHDNNNNYTFDVSGTANGQGLDGVDINRNYGYMWGNVGATDDIFQATYHGTEGFSEPETQAIKQLLDTHHFVAGISYHSYGQLVLYPYGYANDLYGPDVLSLKALADSMAHAIPAINTGTYTPEASWVLYPSMGGLDDYAYGVRGIFGYTIEMGTEFVPPATTVEQIKTSNLHAARILLERAHKSLLKGHICDQNNTPIACEVYVEGIDNSVVPRNPYLSDDFGSYYRLLEPGEYSVTYKKYGYVSQTCLITINTNQETINNVSLLPAAFGSVTGTLVDHDSVTPIAYANITFLNTPTGILTTDEYGEFNIPNIAYGTYTVKIEANDYPSYTRTVIINQAQNTLHFYVFQPTFTDSFENNLTDWQTTWTRTNTKALDGSYSLTDSQGYYGNNQTSACTYAHTIQLQPSNYFFVSFGTTYDLEEGYDYCYFQIKPEGQDWVTIDSFTGNHDWYKTSYDLSSYCGQSVQLRFLLDTDGYTTADGIYIDLFKLYQVVATPTIDPESVLLTDRIIKNYPNPFNPSTNISLYQANDGNALVEIYNMKGQKVRTLLKDKLNKGTHTLTWNGMSDQNHAVASGIYFCRYKTHNCISTLKLLLIK